MPRRQCHAGWCEKPARWAPSYSPLPPVFCSQRCAAEWSHELIASEAESEENDDSRE